MQAYARANGANSRAVQALQGLSFGGSGSGIGIGLGMMHSQAPPGQARTHPGLACTPVVMSEVSLARPVVSGTPCGCVVGRGPTYCYASMPGTHHVQQARQVTCTLHIQPQSVASLGSPLSMHGFQPQLLTVSWGCLALQPLANGRPGLEGGDAAGQAWQLLAARSSGMGEATLPAGGGWSAHALLFAGCACLTKV